MNDKKLTALIVDDEPLARKYIRNCLAPHKDIQIVAEASDGAQAITFIDDQEPDLVFLDIQMPEKDGIQVLKDIVTDNSPAVIFITAYDQFAVEAFEQQAVDYLLKPFDQERFDSALEKVRKTIASKELDASNKKLKHLVQSLTKKEQPSEHKSSPDFEIDKSQNLRIKTSSGSVLIEPSAIDIIESDAYLLIIHTGSKKYSITGTMREIEQSLNPNQFVRIHRRTIVNLAKIASYKPTGTGAYELSLKDGRKLPLSRRRKENLDQKTNQLGH